MNTCTLNFRFARPEEHPPRLLSVQFGKSVPVKKFNWSRAAKALCIFLLTVKSQFPESERNTSPIKIATIPNSDDHWLHTLVHHVENETTQGSHLLVAFGGATEFRKHVLEHHVASLYTDFTLKARIAICVRLVCNDGLRDIHNPRQLLQWAKMLRDAVPEWKEYPLCLGSDSRTEVLVTGETVMPTDGSSSRIISLGNDDKAQPLYTESTWRIHSTPENNFCEVVANIHADVTVENLDVAFQRYQQSLFRSGYHEQWGPRLMISDVLLNAEEIKKRPLDAAYIHLVGKSYVYTELGQFERAEVEIQKSEALFRSSTIAAPNGYARCLRYRGTLAERRGDFPMAMKFKKAALDCAIGMLRKEIEMEIELLELKYTCLPAAIFDKRIADVKQRLHLIGSWQAWDCELTYANKLLERGEAKSAIAQAGKIKYAFETFIIMPRFLKRIDDFIEKAQKSLL